MYRFYHEISKRNENNNTIFISPVTLPSDIEIVLNKCYAGQGSVLCICFFSCNDSMSLAARKWFLRLNIIYLLQSKCPENLETLKY